jgi:hypothetical protein
VRQDWTLRDVPRIVIRSVRVIVGPRSITLLTMLKPGLAAAPVTGTALGGDGARRKRRSLLLLVPPIVIAILYIVVAESAVASVKGYDLGLRWREW